MNLRAIAASSLAKILEEGKSLSTILPEAQGKVAEADRALLQELLFGCCRWFYFLEGVIDNKLERPLPTKEQLTRALLVLGCYQLRFTRIPSHASIHETVEAAKQLGLTKKSGFINAVLRAIAREDAPKIDDQSILQSYPTWFSAKLEANWPEQALATLKASNQHPPMFLRVNCQKISREDYLALLESNGIAATSCVHARNGLLLEHACDVTALPGFRDGMVSVQDEAAQLATELLDLKPGMRILDACAAPGGKTCSMLESEPSLEVLALDHDARRLQRVQENLTRLELKAKLKCASAERLDDWYDGRPFDRILLDVPCSATGVIRRHPDIKLLRTPEDLKKLAEVQLHLLTVAWKTLETKGKLVYATCSVFAQENARIVERFLKMEQSASLSKIDANWGVDTGFGKQLFPQDRGHDGFFYAVINKDN